MGKGRPKAKNNVEVKDQFDPNQLTLSVEGQVIPFKDWTVNYARLHYPHIGRKTYRVPPVDFNTQELEVDSSLGFSRLGSQEEHIRKKDRSQADVGFMLEELGKRLEETIDGCGLFIVANAHYDNYLNELKGMKIKGRQPPLPTEVASRGELDFLVLHPRAGIILIQVKGVGYPHAKWQPKTEEELRSTIQKKVVEAIKQLERDDKVLSHIMRDLDLKCSVHRIVAVPFVTHKLLGECTETIYTSDLNGNQKTKFLCLENLASAHTALDWWHTLVKSPLGVGLTEIQLQSIVGRYCGLLSTVQVWANSNLRVEVRNISEAAQEVGERFANIVLTPEQTAVVACNDPYVYLSGPPGTGKSVLLVIKARQWLLAGNDVCVLNMDFGKVGMPIGHYIQDAINRWLQKTLEGGGERKKNRKKVYDEKFNMASNATDKGCCKVGTPERDLGNDVGTSDVLTEMNTPHENERKLMTQKNPFNSMKGWKGSSKNGRNSSAHIAIKGTTILSETMETTQSDISGAFRLDYDLDVTPPEKVISGIEKVIRSGRTCHFIIDEYYWKERLYPVLEKIRNQFPSSCIWCAEVDTTGAPPGFTTYCLTTVLRCPPTVQAILQRTDWLEKNRSLYTLDSTEHGLPTDGLKPRYMNHQGHEAISPLECLECADRLLDFFKQDLGLEFCNRVTAFEPVRTECETRSTRARDAYELSHAKRDNDRGDKRSPVGLPMPRNKKRNRIIPTKVRFSDVVILIAYPQSCMGSDPSLMLVQAQLQELHHSKIQTSLFYRRFVQAGVPVTFLTPTGDARDIALPAEDKVLVSVTNAIIGLERKVVVYVPCESTKYRYHLELNSVRTDKQESPSESRGDSSVQQDQMLTLTPDELFPKEESRDNFGKSLLNGQDSQCASTSLSAPVADSRDSRDFSGEQSFDYTHSSSVNNSSFGPSGIGRSSAVYQGLKAGISDEDWRRIEERILERNKKGLFYAASRCLSVFVLVVP